MVSPKSSPSRRTISKTPTDASPLAPDASPLAPDASPLASDAIPLASDASPLSYEISLLPSNPSTVPSEATPDAQGHLSDSGSEGPPSTPPSPSTPSSANAPAESDGELKNLLSSFAGWQLHSRANTPSPPYRQRRSTPFLNDTSSSYEDDSRTDASFNRTVVVVKKQQKELRKLVNTLETELFDVREKVSHSLRTSTDLLMRTQDMIVKERRNMEKQHEFTADSIQSLESKLNKAQRHIATLQAQHIADKGLIDQLANEIAVLWEHHQDIGTRLQCAEESEHQVRSLADKLKVLIDEVRARDLDVHQSLAAVLPTLEEELNKGGLSLPSGAEDAVEQHTLQAPTSPIPTLARRYMRLQAILQAFDVVARHLRVASLVHFGVHGLLGLLRCLREGTRRLRAHAGARFPLLFQSIVILFFSALLVLVLVLAPALYPRVVYYRRDDSPIWDSLGA
ncbi:hypothetical protein FKP32DRAFT_1677577 [Trametes sanguinea]|nr:hypothetical protein FKP32DRAFT_1677577 [Trametes sanguinea]